MNKASDKSGGTIAVNNYKPVSEGDSKRKIPKEIKYQESSYERAMKLGSEEVIARAIRDLINRDELN